jgi:hypothetical protein
MKIETTTIKFYLDPNDEFEGVTHAKIIELLKDFEKLERFKQLLETDSNSAYSIFVAENNL